MTNDQLNAVTKFICAEDAPEDRTVCTSRLRVQSPAATVMMNLAEQAWWWPKTPFCTRPGQYFEMLSEATKETLRLLKSDDLKSVRWPLF